LKSAKVPPPAPGAAWPSVATVCVPVTAGVVSATLMSSIARPGELAPVRFHRSQRYELAVQFRPEIVPLMLVKFPAALPSSAAAAPIFGGAKFRPVAVPAADRSEVR